MESRLAQAKSRAEEQLGFGIPEKVAEAVLRYTERKLFLIRLNEEKDDDYMWATHRKLKVETARKIIRKVKLMCEDLKAGVLDEKSFWRKAASYRGMMQHCNSEGLRSKLNGMYEEVRIAIKQKETEVSMVERKGE